MKLTGYLPHCYTQKNKLDDLFQAQDTNGPFDPFLDKLKIMNFGASTTWNKTWNKKIDSSIKLYHSNYSFEYFGQNYSSFILAENTLKRSNSISELGLLINLNTKINDNLIFSTGYQAVNNMLKYTVSDLVFFNVSVEYRRNVSHAIYDQFSLNHSKKWHIEAGLRLNKFGYFSGVYLISKKVFLKARSPKDLEPSNDERTLKIPNI